MPVKNAADFLKICLDSILSQTAEDWELIAINDHSTDETQTILHSYANSDKRIKTQLNQGKGIIDALTTAFELSSGEYITRMDADDIMDSKKLELLLAEVQKDGNSISTGKVEYFAKNGISEGYKKYETWLNNLIDHQNHYSEIYKECVIPSPCWMTRRKTLESIGGFKSLNYPEDYDLCFKFYQAGIKVQGVNQILHYWRDYDSRTSRNDPNYSDNTFIPLKVKYFFLCDYNPKKQLILMGAGKKGKAIAALLIKANQDFLWMTNNPNKIGHSIYHQVLQDETEISLDEKCQVIISIADITFYKEKQKLLNQDSLEVYSFC